VVPSYMLLAYLHVGLAGAHTYTAARPHDQPPHAISVASLCKDNIRSKLPALAHCHTHGASVLNVF